MAALILTHVPEHLLLRINAVEECACYAADEATGKCVGLRFNFLGNNAILALVQQYTTYLA